jgi:hypothetical protein
MQAIDSSCSVKVCAGLDLANWCGMTRIRRGTSMLKKCGLEAWGSQQVRRRPDTGRGRGEASSTPVAPPVLCLSPQIHPILSPGDTGYDIKAYAPDVYPSAFSNPGCYVRP